MADLFNQTMTTLERSLTCELIASDLTQSILSMETPDANIVELAVKHQFSRVPLGHPEQVVISQVALVDLHHQTLQEKRDILPQDMIAGDTPLGRAPQLLQEREFCLVLVQDKIQKILTRSDLNKLPVRVYLSTVLAHLEGLLADAIHKTYPNDTWMGKLSQKRQQDVNNLFTTKQQHDFDTRKIDCTTLSDKSTIIQKSGDLRQDLCDLSRKKFDDYFKKTIIRLRNRLDHGLPALTDDNDTLRNHLAHNFQLTKKTDVDWLADTVSTLLQWIECLTEDEEVLA